MGNNTIFGRVYKSYYFEGIETFKYRWIRCIEVEGKYIEKQKPIFKNK